MTELKAAAKRFLERASAAGLDIQIRQMNETTRTAEDAARACGCEVSQIVKSLVFQGTESGEAYLLLVSGSNRVDQKSVAALIGETLKRPDADFVRTVTGYAIGGIPPLGHESKLETFIDEDLMTYGEVWAAAGTPESVFAVSPKALGQAAQATPITVT